ncbi:MAG TPA: tetratricopeptide repeat protein [Bradyrhizobium sp.]|uniref:tetratricopeptide repeat protein n=1 Tax=Bradyrhizobium sp. TaxID=376 RepID=UPI002BA33B02|nr:tetratricopeptide repeat protein [Bradyrhizobium sp.]HLZ01221.1 tetratricopeptide repeat protein [Bradyrhizobium sp.]
MKPPFAKGMLVLLLLALTPRGAHATGADTATVPPADPAPCMAAITANDDDKVVGACGALIDNEKTEKPDRFKALIARGAVFAHRDQLGRAIADYDVALRLDPTQADIFNARGELWWKKGDRPKALADFAAALKLNPDHPAAKDNNRKLALELERLGALMAVAGKPSFNCATARRPVEKAICANPALANLDREINAANVRAMHEARDARKRQALRREQDDFIARRNADFGKRGYDLKKVMNDRLQRLLEANGT